MHTLELGPEEFPRPHLSIYTGSFQILPHLPHKGGIGFGQGEGQVGGPPHTAGNSFQQLLERAPPFQTQAQQRPTSGEIRDWKDPQPSALPALHASALRALLAEQAASVEGSLQVNLGLAVRLTGSPWG